ncbi:MAG: hypothetical protein JW971_10490 [Synergistales bacterium]|nr:hypothetical protein [Synergistales bacterium]
MNWAVEVISHRRIEENIKVLFSMVPGDALDKAGLEEDLFWEEIERKVSLKAQNYGLPTIAVSSYIRDARRNRTNEVALVVHY